MQPPLPARREQSVHHQDQQHLVPDTNTLQDWGVQAAYLAYLKRYGTREEALRMLDEEYGTRIPTRHPHFIKVTMKLHPRTFILIGLLRTSVHPSELAKQGSLL